MTDDVMIYSGLLPYFFNICAIRFAEYEEKTAEMLPIKSNRITRKHNSSLLHRKAALILCYIALAALSSSSALAENERDSSRSSGSWGGRSNDDAGRGSTSGTGGGGISTGNTGSTSGSTGSGGTSAGSSSGSAASGTQAAGMSPSASQASTSAIVREEPTIRSDQDLAREAVAQGQILALSAVLPELERAAPGRRLSVALRPRGQGWAYDFSVLTPSGVVRRVVIDAKSNKVLDMRDAQ
jgi:uncharacterized membrane protein YkoI